ncbi:MAG: ATP-binding protein [Cloacibacillus sp.]
MPENSFIFALARNSIETVSLILLFLLLDIPRFSWKKSSLLYGLFCGAYIAFCTLWTMADMESYFKYVTLSVFVGALAFFPLMSRDNLWQVFYNLSLQIFVIIFQIEFGMWGAKVCFNENLWADLSLRVISLILAAWIYMHWLRAPYREIADNLKDGWQGVGLVSIVGNLLIIWYWRGPALETLHDIQAHRLLLCIWSLLLITHVMMIRTMLCMHKEMLAKRESSLSAINAGLLRRQLEMTEESVSEARRIRHDTRHHNLQIAEYARNGETDELLRYLNQYEKEAERNLSVNICDNRAANNILNAYLRKAKQNGLKVDLDVVIERDIPIKDTDIVAILANIMENAIRGCLRAKSSNPFIKLSIARRAGKLAILCRNTAETDIPFEYGRPKSRDGEGVGILSILQSAKCYGGETDLQNVDGIFTCRVLLKVPKAENIPG